MRPPVWAVGIPFFSTKAKYPRMASAMARLLGRHARRNDLNCYLDWYDPRLVFTGIAVLVMSCMDALFTLMLLDRGAYEANYFMARLMETSDELFVAVKLALTACGIVFLLMHARFQIWRITSGKRLLQFVVTVYGLLIGYELILLAVLKG